MPPHSLYEIVRALRSDLDGTFFDNKDIKIF